MEEKIIKWSSKKIIWTILLCLVELAFLLWILSFMMTYPKVAPVGLVALRLFVLFLIIIVGWILYERLRLLFSDKEYLKCTPQGFSYKPHPKKDWQFYSWGQVETFSLMRIKGGRSSRDFRLQSNQMFWKSQSTCWMSVYREESLKPCPTLSESGVSNKIVNSIKNLKVKRSKNFIQSIIATIEGKNEKSCTKCQGFFLFLFSKKCVIIESKNFKRKKCYELKRLHCNHWKLP